MSRYAPIDLKMVLRTYTTHAHTYTIQVIGVFDGRPIFVKRHRRFLYFSMRVKLLN